MIVREEPDAFVLVEQDDHARVSGEFARRWRKAFTPRGPTLYAIAEHDVGWRELDRSVAWDESSGKPYSFVTYPMGPKLRAYEHGIDRVEAEDAYAACLCSMHYTTIVGAAGGEAGERFVRSEEERQRRLKEGMSGEELANLDYNLGLLKLCDGLSLFVCLNRPGETDRPPPYPQGLWLAGTRYEFVWVGRESLRVDPNPFLEPFDVTVPYHKVGKDRRAIGSDSFSLRVTC